MAVIVKLSDPSALLKEIKKAIDDKKIETWSYDKDGDFTHTPSQWKNKAWLRPKIYTGELRFGILKPTDTTLTTEVYAVYHGRFIEMLLAHFDKSFTQAGGTAQKTEPDNF
jgi:hypothetical protein